MANEAVPPNPSGLCGCGCGERTEIAPRNYKPRGWVKGHPKRFINGHQSRSRGPLYKVDAETGCWIWQLYVTPKGYGLMHDPRTGSKKLAHCIFYEREYGPIPEGYRLHHKCETKRCVNPHCLEPLRATPHARKHAPKLTIKDARAIRALVEAGKKHREVAEMFGIALSMVGHIVSNRAWQELEEGE